MTNVAKEFRLLLKSVYLLFSPVRSNLEESGLAISGSEIVTHRMVLFNAHKGSCISNGFLTGDLAKIFPSKSKDKDECLTLSNDAPDTH